MSNKAGKVAKLELEGRGMTRGFYTRRLRALPLPPPPPPAPSSAGGQRINTKGNWGADPIDAETPMNHHKITPHCIIYSNY